MKPLLITYVKIEGIDGPITGTVRLYEQRISGGKSEDRSRSVGFFVNVRGRVIALDDPYFGLENLSHGAWAHFRCLVRADGLDAILNVERDTLRDGPQLRLFRALLRALFNKARSSYVGMSSAVWPNAGELLEKRWDAFLSTIWVKWCPNGLARRSRFPVSSTLRMSRMLML